MLLDLKDILGSLLKSLDIIYVIEGIKPVSRLLYKVDEGSSQKLLTFLKKNYLAYEFSNFKVLKHIDNNIHP